MLFLLVLFFYTENILDSAIMATHIRLQFNLFLTFKLHVKQCLYDNLMEIYMIEITNLRRISTSFENY